MQDIKRNQVIELEIGGLAFGGTGVGRTAGGIVVFVEDALPGQLVTARITRKKKRHAEARLVEVLRQGPGAVEPRCRHFGPCGGCRLQHLDYNAQLEAKGEQVREILERIGGFVDPPLEPAIPSPRVFGYRNKMEYSFGEARWLTPEEMEDPESVPGRDFALGLHPRRQWFRTIHLEECHLPSPLSVEIMKEVQRTAGRSDFRPYTTKTHRGFWRFLVVREAVRTGQWMVDLITSDEPGGFTEVETLADHLKAALPEITTVTHTTTRTKSSVATGDRERVLVGPGYIEEEIGGLRFRISPRAFFQTNTEGAERLYEEAVRSAALQGGERVFDIYCGTGTIALLMAGGAGEVVGFEREPSAVVDARANAELNGITNAEFLEGDAADLLKGGSSWGEPDVIVLDPPRAGLHPDVRSSVTGLEARRLVYVSCNPTTLAADLAAICRNSYELKLVKPLDMFPHTPHVECVSLLERI